MKIIFNLLLMASLTVHAQLNDENNPPIVKTANGVLEGVHVSGIRTFKGIPFAQPPVGPLRWKAPLPVKNWEGVKTANKFGPRAMQLPLYGDMGFRSDGMSEDCLYLNVWTPAMSATEKLPVLVYFFGGGFMAGDGSEARYDGESMARQGIVSITVNQRLTIFGFFTHPELSKESPQHASGNYGLIDQYEALRWIQTNIAAFGGDPKRVTIAGESAGSFAVSAQMASPLSKNLFAGAIGESGSLLGLQPTTPLADAEKIGLQFGNTIGAASLEALRAMPAEQLLQATAKPGTPRFPVTVDGYFFSKSPLEIYSSGQQAHVPLLVGWNSEESGYRSIMGKEELTVPNYTAAVQKLYGAAGDAALKAYAASGDGSIKEVATALAGDRFIGFSTWKWSDLQSKTGGKNVYRYMYSRPRPHMRTEMGNAVANLAGGVTRSSDSAAARTLPPPPATGAVHSAEIEYAMGNLPHNRVYDWQPEDYKVSEIMQSYFANFVKTGNPNGTGLPKWPAVNGTKEVPVMMIDVQTRLETEKHRERYLFLETQVKK